MSVRVSKKLEAEEKYDKANKVVLRLATPTLLEKSVACAEQEYDFLLLMLTVYIAETEVMDSSGGKGNIRSYVCISTFERGGIKIANEIKALLKNQIMRTPGCSHPHRNITLQYMP